MTDVNGDYDYVVVGCGGIGSGAVYWLSRRAGKRVLGLEQLKLGHENGGSQDHSRIIRMTYRDEKYARLTRHAYDSFEEVERESGLKLVHKTGSLVMSERGTNGESEMELHASAMDRANTKYERLDAGQLKARFPQFTPTKQTVALYERDGGLVDAALANSVHIQLAQARGATVLDNTPVTRIDTAPDGTALVWTPHGKFSCKRVVVTAGAWINNVLGNFGLHIPVRVTQEQVTYYATPHPRKFTKDKMPVFMFRGYNGRNIYGMPMHVNSGTKIGMDAAGPVVSAESRTFIPDPAREEECQNFLKSYIPEFLGPVMYTKTCLYTMTLDRDFIVDTLQGEDKPQVIICNGAGHAFKFASLLGKILSELAVDSTTGYDISGFRINRPGITDPNFTSFVKDMKPTRHLSNSSKL